MLYDQSLLYCFDNPSEIEISSNEDYRQSLVITIDKCQNQIYCKSQEEIDLYLEKAKLLILKYDWSYELSKYDDQITFSSLKVDASDLGSYTM